MDAVDPRHPVGAGDDDVVEARVAVDGCQSAAKGSRRDRRDIVDEPLCGQFRELDGHVAAHGDHVIPLGTENRVEHPVFMGALVEHLFAGLGLDRPQGVVGTSEGDQRAVRRPRPAVEGVERDRHRPQ